MSDITTSDGVRIRIHELRTGTDNLLLLHGVGRSARTFASYATQLPSRFRIRAIDFRGHGDSGRAPDRYQVVDYVHDALAAVDAIGGRLVIHGHSLGALASMAVAASRPDAIQAVVLEDPPSTSYWQSLASTNYFPTFRAMQQLAGQQVSVSELARQFGQCEVKTFSDGRVLRIVDVRDPISLRFTAACLRDLDPDVMQAVLADNWPAGFDFDCLLQSIQCPVLLLRGDVAKGGMLPDDDATHIMSLLCDGVRMDFANAGHLLHWQVRSDLATNVSAFLDSL